MTPLSIFFDVAWFFLLSLFTGPSFMPMSSLVLKLWQFTIDRKQIDRKSRNQKYHRLSFAQYLETGASWG